LLSFRLCNYIVFKQIESVSNKMNLNTEREGDLKFKMMSEISLNHGQEFVGPPL